MVYTTKNRFNLFLLLITIFNASCGSSLQNKHDILSLSQVNEDFKALTMHIEKDVLILIIPVQRIAMIL